MDSRGAAPIPEEHQKAKKPLPPQAPPEPPPEDDARAHEDFERARVAAAKKRDLTTRPLSFKKFLPRLPSSPSKKALHEDGHVRDSNSADSAPPVPILSKPKSKRGSFTRFLPRLPSTDPNDMHVTQDEHDEFDRLKKQAEAKRPAPPKHDQIVDDAVHAEYERYRQEALAKKQLRVSTPLARAFGGGTSFFNRGSSSGPDFFVDVEDEKAGVENKPKYLSNPPPPVFKSTREKIMYQIRYQHLLERCLMAAFAVCLLWLTSLAVAQSIVYSLIVGPSLDSVLLLSSKAVNFTQSERELYEACVLRNVGDCNRTFLFDLASEVSRTEQVLNQNRKTLESYTNSRGNCSEHFGEVVLSLDLFTRAIGSINPNFGINFTNNPVCSGVIKTLQDQLAAIRAHSTAEKFKASADEDIGAYHNQFRKRAAYDSSFLQNVTGFYIGAGTDLNTFVTDPVGAMNNLSSPRDVLFACMVASGQSGSQTCPHPSVMQRVNGMRSSIQSSYSTSINEANGYANDVQQQFTPMATFYNNFRNALSSVAGLKVALDGGANQNGANGGGLAAFGFVDTDATIDAPSFDSLATFLEGVGTTDAANANGVNAQNNMISSNGQTQGTMQNDADNTKNGQTGWVNPYFSDYNPPPFDVEGADYNWRKSSSEYLPEIQSNLQLVSTRVETRITDDFSPTTNTTDARRHAENLLNDPTLTPLSVFTYDGINPYDVLDTWHQITQLALVMDYAFRVLHSLTIIRSYWKVSAVMAPPADVRVGQHAKGIVNKKRMTPDQLIAYWLTHPLVNLILLLIFLGILTAAFLKVYLPFFNDYVSGCITANSEGAGQVEGNGTMITRNVYTVAFTYAAGKGDAATAQDIDRINVERSLQCSTNENLVFKQQVKYQEELNFNLEKQAELMEKVNSFRQCVNVTKIDQFFPFIAPNATNGTSNSIRASLFHPTCDVTFNSLNPSQFQCNAIRTCIPSCTGPAAEQLNLQTYDAGCNGEFYIHSGILGSAFSFLAYILMNLSRWTFLRGLRRMFMSHFATGDYSYLATTNEFGDIEYPERVTVEGMSMKDVIRDELHETVKRYERSGIYISLGGLALNIPWVVGLIFFANNLKFVTSNE